MTAPARQMLTALALALACVGSALGVVYSSHVCRAYYAPLQTLESDRWAAQAAYSRLLLQESTLASPHRVLGIATERLGMRVPGVGADRVVVQ